MKKVFSIITVAFVAASFVACGPSAEDKAKMEEREKQIKDSIAASITESMGAVEAVVDSAAAVVSTATEAATEEVKK